MKGLYHQRHANIASRMATSYNHQVNVLLSSAAASHAGLSTQSSCVPVMGTRLPVLEATGIAIATAHLHDH
jgi:hypothetical protein